MIRIKIKLWLVYYMKLACQADMKDSLLVLARDQKQTGLSKNFNPCYRINKFGLCYAYSSCILFLAVMRMANKNIYTYKHYFRVISTNLT